MKTIITIVLNAIGSSLASILCEGLSCAKALIQFLNGKRRDKKEAEAQAKVDAKNSAIDDACNNGTLEDLLDATKGVKK